LGWAVAVSGVVDGKPLMEDERGGAGWTTGPFDRGDTATGAFDGVGERQGRHLGIREKWCSTARIETRP
jgi:hypothetical protein